MMGHYGWDQPNFCSDIFSIPQMSDESPSVGERRTCDRRILRGHSGAHIVFVQGGGNTAATAKAGTKEVELLDFGQLWCYLDDGTATHYVDCDTVVYDLALPQDRNAGPRPQKSSAFGNFVPVLFLPWDKPEPSDSLLVCFGALALSQATGILADTGTLIYGDGLPSQNRKDCRTTLSGRARLLTQSGLLGAAGSRHRLS